MDDNNQFDDAVDLDAQDVVSNDSSPAMVKLSTYLEGCSAEQLQELVTSRIKFLGEAAFEEAIKIKGSYDQLLVDYTNVKSVEAYRTQESISNIKDKTLFDTRLVRDGKTILGNIKPRKETSHGASLSGADALAAFAIRDKWMKRIPLYNSGFSIDIIPPSLAALNTFFNKTHDRTSEYGRRFGGLFFYYYDLLIKEALVELILPLIINSTLRDTNTTRSTMLTQNIKLVDLKIILNTIGAMMFPDGFTFTHICQTSTGKCSHTEELLIDINKLQRYDFSKMSNDCIQHMSRQIEVTPELLAQYHTKLGFDNREIRWKQYGFIMRVPSLDNYLEYGRIYNGELTSTILASNSDTIQRAVLYSFYQIYVPFIRELVLYDENNNRDIVTPDQDVISKILLRLQSEGNNDELIKKFDQYVADTEIGYVCYPAMPCPECNYLPESGYYTVDPSLTFFIQSLMKLNQS